MKENNDDSPDEEEVTIDLSKVKSFFKKGEQKVEEEEKKVEEEIEKEERKIEKLEEKKEKIEEKEEEIEERIDEEKEKENELRKKESELKQKEKSVKQEKNKIRKKEEGIKFDIKKIKNIFKKKENLDDEDKSKPEQKSSVNLKKVLAFIKKNKIFFLILIPIFFSIYFRAYPASLPITDDWARETVYSSIQGSIGAQINQQYPNLPDQQKQALIQKQFNEIISSENEAIENQITQTSAYFKSRLQDEDGQTYLLAIDPWLWYGYARNYIRNSHFGNILVNGTVPWYTLRNGREGQMANFQFLPFLIALNYKIMNIFTDTSVMAATFYMPVICFVLASIAAFFIGKKIGGYPAALAASIIIGTHAALLGRTAAGFADTDNILILFSVLTVMFFVLAFEEKNRKKEYLCLGLAGISMGLYALGHGQSWWHIFDVIGGALALYLIWLVWINRKELNKGIKGLVKIERIQNLLRTGIGFLVSTWVFGTIILTITGMSIKSSLMTIIKDPITQPLRYMGLKQVAVKTVWPNVMTTVAELNTGSWSTVISQIGGKFLFF
ncbi:hypothetical protein JW707_04205, partial [Candidatus Woesearchaeota archaeon]|nr:hypothetical protein [Candidatus Woesearchaeota archaeon]